LAVRISSLCGVLAFSAAACGGDWPQWRGPDRDGVCKETGLLKSWPEGGPKQLWKREGLGTGYASLAIAGGKIYTMADRGGKALVLCLDLQGAEQWATPIGKEWGDGGSRCTPTVAGDKVYALTGHGELACLSTAGKLVWRKEFAKDFGGRMMTGWGYCESPTIDGDTLVATPGGDQAAVVALDAATGESKWQAAVPNCGGAGYTGVAVGTIAGIKQYVGLLGKQGGCVGLDAATGKLLWQHNKVSNGTANIPTPIVFGNLVLYSTGYGDGGTACLKIAANGSGARATEVYSMPANGLQNHHGGMVRVGDYVYGGHGHNNGFPFCLNIKTGKEAWKHARGPGNGSAAALFADGRLYLRYESGVLAMFDTDPKKPVRVVGKLAPPQSGAPAWSHPAIADGVLYLRDQNLLMAYDVKAK
jgi:outer membrane protein assembly factor BamB